ncbi:MAG: exodeoxyribonuclease V subunit gamma [Euzebya sp.]
MLSIVRAGRGDDLAGALAGRLRTPLADPLAAEQIVVNSRGMERWLSQCLSRHLGQSGDATGDGICANMAFPFPGEIIGRTIRAAGGPNPSHSVWSPERLVWPLLAQVQSGLGRWAAPLLDRIGDNPDQRFSILRGVADLLDRYSVHRPDLVLRWLDGQDVDAAGRPLDAAARWQPELLRLLRVTTAQPTLAESVVATVSNVKPPPDLPGRISVFGFTALPSSHLAILVALATVIDVDLYLLHPSPGLWGRWADFTGQLDDRGLPVLPARAELDLVPPHNRLLRSWGRDSREMQLVVATVAGATATESVGTAASSPPRTLLEHLQAGIRADADGEPDVVTGQDDRSIQIHSCHGRTRQVQVLRDEILRLLQHDPTLEPRDIVVMCPDVETYAPLIKAHLAVPEQDPDGRPDLRVRLADRSLRQSNPLLKVIDDLLGLAAGRVSATRLLDLAGSEPVRRRFGFSDDDLEQLEEWITNSGMRWGLDVADRRRDGVSAVAGSIEFGLSRLLLGVAMADEDDRTLNGVTPLDEVEGGDVALAGRLAELVARLGSTLVALRTPMPVSEWMATLARACGQLLREPAKDPWQRTQALEVLEEVAQTAAVSGDEIDLELSEIRALLDDRLKGQPSRANHRTGDLTVCTLVPMRSVPHRVICLLGMDDEVFPRRSHAATDDLIARHPRVGDRDTRTEDRQLLLDAIMAAEDAVVVTYSGIDERSGQKRSPCVPIAELIRVIDRLAASGSATFTTSHPLHPHDPAAFTPARPGFDPQAFAAAKASLTPGRTWPMSGAVQGLGVPAVVDVDRLVACLQNPAHYFYRHTVGAYVPGDPEEPDQQVPLTVGGLAQWKLGEDLLADGRVNDPDLLEQVIAAGRGRGALPADPWGQTQIQNVTASAADVVALLQRLDLGVQSGGGQEIDVDVAGRRMSGEVGGVHGDRHVEVTFSKIKGKHIVAAWVRLLALTLHDPTRPWEAFVVGRHEKKKARVYPPHAVHFPPLGADAAGRQRIAQTLLADLLDLHDDVLRQPLAAPANTAAVYAIQRVVLRHGPAEADDLAAERWDHNDFGFGFDADLPAHLLLFGDSVPYEVLRRQPARPQDTRLGHDPEPHQFGGLAMRVWAPLLTRCKAAT